MSLKRCPSNPITLIFKSKFSLPRLKSFDLAYQDDTEKCTELTLSLIFRPVYSYMYQCGIKRCHKYTEMELSQCSSFLKLYHRSINEFNFLATKLTWAIDSDKVWKKNVSKYMVKIIVLSNTYKGGSNVYVRTVLKRILSRKPWH